MRCIENLDIREMAVKERIYFKEIAEQMGLNYHYFSRLLSKPLSLKDKVRIIDAIQEIKAKRGF